MTDQQATASRASLENHIRDLITEARRSVTCTVNMLVLAGLDALTVAKVMELIAADMQRARVTSAANLKFPDQIDQLANFLGCRVMPPEVRAYLGLPSVPGDEQQPYVLSGAMADNIQEEGFGRLQVTLLYDLPPGVEQSPEGVSNVHVADAAQAADDDDMAAISDLTESIIAGTCPQELNVVHDLLCTVEMDADALDVVRVTIFKILQLSSETAVRVEKLSQVREMLKQFSGE